jgi:ribosomal subunit interface protein
MQIQVETDHNVESNPGLTEHVESVILDAVGRYHDHLTHVEAHLGDTNADRAGAQDKQCLLEARMAGVKTIVVSHRAETLHMAIDGAATKLQRALDSSIGKLQDRQRRSEGVGHLSADLLAQDPDAA